MDLLSINNQLIDLESDTDVKITYQVADIGAVAQNKCSFSNSFKIPKSRKNIKALDGLSLAGDTSDLPYKKIPCTYQRDGSTLISNGWAVIESVNEYFNVHVYEGVIDLYKDMENQTIGNTLNLEKASHVKNLDTVIDSFTNEYYRYLLADYNGNVYYNGAINIDYLVPSIRLKYIIEQIAYRYGWVFKGSIFSNADYLNSWITYPQPTIAETESIVQNFIGKRGAYFKTYNSSFTIPAEEIANDKGYKNWNIEMDPTEGATMESDNWSIRLPALKDGEAPGTRTYLFDVTLDGFIQHVYERKKPFSNDDNATEFKYVVVDFILEVHVNGNLIEKSKIFKSKSSQFLTSGQGVSTPNTIPNVVISGLSGGDVLSFRIVPASGGTEQVNNLPIPLYGAGSYYRGCSMTLQEIDMQIQQVDAGGADFGEVLKDFKITDLFKKFVTDFGLTIYTDKYDKIATFLTMEERVSKGIIYDYTQFYKERTEEVYQLDKYAQLNKFRYKYNESNADYNDGIIKINDVNLEDETTLFESKFYSPEKENSGIDIAWHRQIVPLCKIWDKQIEEKDGQISIKYKELDKRFYILRHFMGLDLIADFTSAILKTPKRRHQGLPIATFAGLNYQQIINTYWKETEQILNDSRLHTIELNMPVAVMADFDLAGIYYFAQEGMYYMPNSLTISKNKIEGEFIRIKSEVLSSCPVITDFRVEVIDNPRDNNQLFDIILPYVKGYVNNIYYRPIRGSKWIKAEVSYTTDGAKMYTHLYLPFGLYDVRFRLDNGRCSNVGLESGVGKNGIGIPLQYTLNLTGVDGIDLEFIVPQAYKGKITYIGYEVYNIKRNSTADGILVQDLFVDEKIKWEEEGKVSDWKNGRYDIGKGDDANEMFPGKKTRLRIYNYQGSTSQFIEGSIQVYIGTTEGEVVYEPLIDFKIGYE